MSDTKPIRLFRPSNGTEGYSFIAEWCDDCERDRLYQEDPSNHDGCEILARSFRDGGVQEWVYGDDGYPKCTAWVESGKLLPPEPDTQTHALFDDASPTDAAAATSTRDAGNG